MIFKTVKANKKLILPGWPACVSFGGDGGGGCFRCTLYMNMQYVAYPIFEGGRC